MPESRQTETLTVRTYFLGIDGGGSKCRASLCTEDGHIVGRGIAGTANPFQSVSRTIESITASVAAALGDAGLAESHLQGTHAGVGLAGVNLPALYRKIADWPHGFASMHLTTDLEIACYGAHNGPDGAVIVAGTGSGAFVSVNGQRRIYGAHGFSFGDTASGAWLGHQAVRAVLVANDGLGPSTALSEALEEIVGGCGVTMVERMMTSTPRDFARLAPTVFDAAGADDAVATAIVGEGAAYLDRTAERLWEHDPPRMSLLGGLRELYASYLSPATLERLSPPAAEPDAGALLYVRTKVLGDDGPVAGPSAGSTG